MAKMGLASSISWKSAAVPFLDLGDSKTMGIISSPFSTTEVLS